MTRERLEQYGKIKKEIISLRKRITALASKEDTYASDTVSASSKNFPYIRKTITIMGRTTKKDEAIKEVRKRLKDREARLIIEAAAIEGFIDGISDSEMRQIIEHRYIDGFSWQRIAFEIGVTDEQYPRRKHKNFFEKFKI